MLLHNGVGKKDFEDVTCNTGIKVTEWNWQSVLDYVGRDNGLESTEHGMLRKF